MPGVCLVPVPHQPCFVSKTKPETNYGIECNHVKCLAAPNGSQNVFLGDSLVSNFMKFGNQEWKKLASSFSSWLTNYDIGGDHIEHVLWCCVNVNLFLRYKENCM